MTLRSKQEDAKEKKEREKALFEAMLMLRNKEECAVFFTDLCTPSELQAMADRWLVARLLYEDKKSYRQIHEETGISLVTIGRVARFLTQESYQGYRLVLQRAKNLALDRH